MSILRRRDKSEDEKKAEQEKEAAKKRAQEYVIERAKLKRER